MMKKRLFAAFVSLCMIVSMLPTMAFAEAGAQDSGIVTSASGLCEHHTQHDSACGYTEGTAEIPCSHEHTEDCYTLVTECVHEHTAECYSDGILPMDGEEKTADSCSHVCSEESGCITKTLDCKHQHDEACGYVPATEGTPCTFVCEVCNAEDSGNAEDSSDAQPEECTCETLCSEEEVNADCPVCSAEGAELDKVCIGAAPMLAAAAPLSSEHSGHDGWTELSGTINELGLPSGNYVLTGDVTLGEDLTRNESVTICLNGHKIYGNTRWLCNVTICDCTGNGNMYNCTNMYNISLSNVKLRDCEITGSATIDGNTTIYAGCTIAAGADESITINSNTTITSGVEIRLTDSGILSFNGANVQSMINMNYGTCNISGTTEIKNYPEGASAVKVNGGTCNITGGTISSPIEVSGGTCDITGGTISSPIEVSEGTCNITGGTINVYDYTSSEETTGAVVVKGGSCNIGGDAQITGRIDNGGAVSVLGGSCTISGSNINKNNTKYGGVYVENGTCTIAEDASITSNQAFDQGGGVYVEGGICNIYGTIGSNYTADNYDGDGGGVYVAGGECNIYGTIYNNTAKRDGGGVYVADGNCNIAATSINYNEAARNGGGIYVAGGECRIATQTIGLNTATGNGGGVYVASGAKVTVNNTQAGPPRITHNTANGNGGGVYLCEGVEWNNLCYVTTNTAQYGGGIYSEGNCKLEIRMGSVENNTATVEGGGLYLNDSQEKPCIVEITNWTIKENKDNSSRPNNMVSLNSQITYEQGLSTQDTLPYEEPGSIILKDSASFTIMSGKYEASEISSCFTRQSDNKILIAGGYYDADPSKEPTLTVVDGVKAIELDGDNGYNQYDPNYPWAVYPVKDGIMSGTSNNPVYDRASIEKDGDFSLSGTTDIQKLYYWYKAQGAEDSAYVAGLPSDAGDYTIKVGGLHLRTIGEEYYTECTFDLTIAKADPSYTMPAGITAQVGKPLSTVTLPKGWAWKDESTIPQTEGTQTYPAIFTPDDTANYNTVETDISVRVVNEPVVQEYAITFDANGGSVNPDSATTTDGKLESLPTPTRGGYTFLGWYTEKDGGEKVTTDTVFTENSTIYAHWQKQAAQAYTVTFDANGGTINSGVITSYTYGVGATLPTDVTREGYTFAGWYASADFSGDTVTAISAEDTGNKTYWAKWTANAYGITVTNDGNGEASADKTTAAEGETVTLTATPNSGYHFERWDVVTGNVTIDDNTFTMPAEAVAIKAIFVRNSAVTPPINPPTVSEETTDAIQDAQPGETVTVDLSSGSTTLDKEVFETLAGRDVTLVIDLGGDVFWTVKGSDISEDADFTDIDMGVTMGSDGIPVDVVNAITGERDSVQITLAHDGAFGFTMTLTAPLGTENAGLWANLYHFNESANKMTFETAAPIGSDGRVSLALSHASQYAIVIDDHNHGVVTLPFTDVSDSDWFYDPVCYVYSQGLMTGTSATTFEPNTSLSRAMLVAVLHRLEGSPPASGSDFTDVADGDWYAQAVNWAASVGVVNGFDDGTFQPNAAITREQMAAILRNYAAYKGMDVTATGDLTYYSDANSISAWAKDSVEWAVDQGLLSGMTVDTLQPQGLSTRAQVAAVLERYLTQS